MDNKQITFADFETQQQKLIEILQSNKLLMEVLQRMEAYNLPNWYVGAGSIANTVWNYYHGFDLTKGIKDIDVIYFDNTDLSYEAEDKHIKKLDQVFKNFPLTIELRNQARVHLWFHKKFGKEVNPYISSEEAIYTWSPTASAIGVRKNNSKIIVYAPLGLSDLFNLIVKPNKVMASQQAYEGKMERWKTTWPKLTVLPW